MDEPAPEPDDLPAGDAQPAPAPGGRPPAPPDLHPVEPQELAPRGFRVRSRCQPPSSDGVVFRQSFEEALECDISGFPEPLIEVLGEEPLAFVDVDTHSWEHRPSTEVLEAWIADVRPVPRWSWATHGGGARLVYQAPDQRQARRAAVAAAFSWPVRGCTIDLPKNTRHPRGPHPKYPGVEAGPVREHPAALSDAKLRFFEAARTPPEPSEVGSWLEARGLTIGGSYGHDVCPICPEERRSDKPVKVYEWGLLCFACRGHGRMYPGGGGPGAARFAVMIGGRSTAAFSTMAAAWVHWSHARRVLEYHYGDRGLTDRLLREAYVMALESADTPGQAPGFKDPRVWRAMSRDLRFLRSDDGLWRDDRTLRAVKLSNATYRVLPWCLAIVGQGDDAKTAPVGPRLDRAADAHQLEGYPPIRPIQGALLRPDALSEGVTPVQVPRDGARLPQVPCTAPMPWSQAWRMLSETFPGISEPYVRALIAAAACAEAGTGRPAMILAHGPSGSGKGAILSLVNGLLGGCEGFDIQIDGAEERWLRQIGTFISRGAKYLRIPEIGKVHRLYSHLGKLLALSETVTWRPLHGVDIHTPFRAALIMNSLAPPLALVESPEVCRRVRSVRLATKVPEWTGRCPTGLSGWRDQSEQHAHAADSLIAHVLDDARRLNWDWEAIADAIGLSRLADEEGGLDEVALGELYDHCCGRGSTERELSGVAKYPGRNGWVDLTSPGARGTVDRLLPDHAESSDGLRTARFILVRNLESADWPSILGLQGSTIRFEGRTHGRAFVGRFIDGPSGGKGKGRAGAINEGLPAQHRQAPSGTVTGPSAVPSTENCCNPGVLERNRGVPSDSATTPSSPSASTCPPATSRQQPHERLVRKPDGAGSTAAQSTVLGADGTPDGALTVLDGARGTEAQSSDSGPDGTPGGHPASTLVLDFETYFDKSYSLKKLSVAEYVNDPRFVVHGLAVKRDGRSAEFHTDVAGLLQELTASLGAGWPDVTVVMHNAAFDAYVLSRIYGVRPAHLVCTQSMATAILGRGLASLRAVAERFGLEPKGEIETEGLRDLTPAQLSKLAEYAAHDAELTAEVFPLLLARLPRPDIELRLIEHTSRLGVERSIGFDRNAAEKLKAEILAEVQTLVDVAGVDRPTLRSTKRFEEAVRTAGGSIPKKRGKSGQIPALAKTDDWMQLQHLEPRVQALIDARLAVASESQTLARIDTLLRLDAAHGGIPPVLAYAGSHTGRWSGAGSGINLQNLPSRGGGAKTKIRKLLVARPDKRLIGADLGQIEARVLAWVAGQDDLLAAFAEDRDVYSEFAANTFGEEVRKPRDDDPPDVAKRLKALRHVGKTAVLGLGYRMGGQRFWSGLQQAPELAALVASGELSPAVAATVVRSYRTAYSRIAGIWKAAEEAALDVIGGVSRRDVGPLSFRWSDDSLLLDLPSGRWLRYRAARTELRSREIEFLDGDGNLVKKRIDGPQILARMPEEKALHGGVFIENAVQAIARDVLAEAMLRIENAGFEIILHVHDEVVVEVPTNKAAAALETICGLLRQPPAWAPSLPLAVDGWESACYDK